MKNLWITGLAFLRYMTGKKAINFVMLWASFHLSRLLKKPLIWGKPATLSIEPTTSCNLRCPECPSGLRSFTRPTGMLSMDLFQKVIDQSHSTLQYLHLYFQGEPYLHPEFSALVSYADAHKIFTSTSTNAHYLNEENVEKTLDSGLKQLIVSMDGISQEIYQQYRVGGKVEKVKVGLQMLLKRRNERNSHFPRIILQFLVTGQNEHEIPSLRAWGRSIGVDEIQLKSTQIYDFENGSPLIPKDLTYSRYIPAGNGKWKLKKKIANKCWRMWQGAVITWDGKVVPCCFDKDAYHVMGTVQEERLSDIWKKRGYNDFRKQLLDNRSQIDMCRNCTE